MKTIDDRIKDIDNVICEEFDTIDFRTRGQISTRVLKYLRDLVEHIAVKEYTEKKNVYVNIDWNVIPLSIEYLKTSNEYFFLRKLHHFLKSSSSHYTRDNEEAERLMIKYYEYLIQLRKFVDEKYGLVILHNLESFPIELDKTLLCYYSKIVDKLLVYRSIKNDENWSQRFYVQNIKPFFVNRKAYYETTLIPANDKTSKFNRLVVFSTFRINDSYAVKVLLDDDIIEISEKFMPIKIMKQWMTSIRPCEIKNFAKIFGIDIELNSSHFEYTALMNYISKTGLNLVDVLNLGEKTYKEFKEEITKRAKTNILCPIFDRARQYILHSQKGSNVVRYLLYCLNNKVIKMQLQDFENNWINYLYLKNECLPFDTMPFASSLKGHNPSIYDISQCISDEGRLHELLAHQVRVNADSYGRMYIEKKEFFNIEPTEVDELVKRFNSNLSNSKKQQARRLAILGENVFCEGFENDAKKIILRLRELAMGGIEGYRDSFVSWLNENPNAIDSDEKKQFLLEMFEKSKVALIYGAAGTGKSYLIDHISGFWIEKTKVYLSTTNPAVENLKRKVKSKNNAEFMTITKYLNSSVSKRNIDILFIDECSMVSNQNMVDILECNNFGLLILAGDIYQIEAIRFGNWFKLAKKLIPMKSQYELTEPHRAKNENLRTIWKKVRNYDDDLAEWLIHYGYIYPLDNSIFMPLKNDEIILCLNYDGLYGINNINRFLQYANPEHGYQIGVWTYKVGDPILFNEGGKYDAVLYNNLKGTIINIEETKNEVFFQLKLKKSLIILMC